jgi:predicted GIY-YIG superfamily endonuclease
MDEPVINTNTELPNEKEEKWVFYIIHNKGSTYAGVSPDPIRRLRKHNKEISGGAKYTLSRGNGWEHVCLISGFHTKIQSMQFEWAVKHVPPRDSGGLINRIKKLYTVLNKDKWTSKSPDASTVSLKLEWKININDITSSTITSTINRHLPAYIEESFL